MLKGAQAEDGIRDRPLSRGLGDVYKRQDLPSLIIGMPVGFIGVENSKNKLISTDLPRIVLNSTRGGAAMAAAAVNALLRETI